MRLVFALFATLLGFSATACSDSKWGDNQPVTVEDVNDNIRSWDGQIYRVTGWLGRCEGLDCALYPTLDDARIVASDDYDRAVWSRAMDRRLGIASMGDFDDRAAPYQFQEVELTALVHDQCRGWQSGCTDRVPDLIPFDITPINPANEAE